MVCRLGLVCCRERPKPLMAPSLREKTKDMKSESRPSTALTAESKNPDNDTAARFERLFTVDSFVSVGQAGSLPCPCPQMQHRALEFQDHEG